MSLYVETLVEAKADLGLTDSTDDAVLTRAMEGLQGRFEDYTNRLFLRATGVTEIHDGGRSAIYVRRYPIESVNSVIVDVDQDWTGATPLTASDYLLDVARGRILYGRGTTPWPEGKQNVRVVYVGGYEAAGTTPGVGLYTMPEGLRRAFSLQLGFEWRNRRTLGQQSVSGQGANISLAPAEFLPDVKDALQSYMRYA